MHEQANPLVSDWQINSLSLLLAKLSVVPLPVWEEEALVLDAQFSLPKKVLVVLLSM